MTDTSAAAAPPVISYLKRDAQGRPFLQGSRCTACKRLFVGERDVCPACTTRNAMEPTHLAEAGTVFTYTIVHRSFPGVATPFVDVIVDLDDGSHIKGTLRDVKAGPDTPLFGMPVKVVFGEAEPVNAAGKPHLSYFFVPV